MNEALSKDMVLSTRVRLARNFADVPFPNMLSLERAEDVVNKAASAIAKSPVSNDFSLIFLKNSGETDNNAMVERHLISPDLLKHIDRAAVLLNKKNSVSIMICEEDHLRIQAIFDGCGLEKAYAAASEIDDYIAENETYAFSGRYGYLTACPTNAGTGLRASFMLHLPALSMLGNQIQAISQAVGRLGLTVRGFYGEGSRAFGSIYQISNQITLGRSEEDIMKSLEDTSAQLIEKEAAARKLIMKNNEAEIKDKLMRSYGVLLHAYKLGSHELLQLWSDLRLALSTGVITDVTREAADALLRLQPAELLQRTKTDLDPKQRDVFRAECTKLILSGHR